MVGGGGNGKNKATLGGFGGINITIDPGSAGQGARCGSLMGHWSCGDSPGMLVLPQLTAAQWHLLG